MPVDVQLVEVVVGLLIPLVFSVVLMGFCLGKDKSKGPKGVESAPQPQEKPVVEAPVAPETTPAEVESRHAAESAKGVSSAPNLPETAGDQPVEPDVPAASASKKSQPKSATKATEEPNAPGGSNKGSDKANTPEPPKPEEN